MESYDHRLAQDALRQTLRQSMLDAAARILQQDGIAGLTVRKVAEAVNVSTTLLYSCFGGKDGLADALYQQGFRLFFDAYLALGEQQAEVAPGLDRLRWYAMHYRRFAHEQSAYYQIMFGDAMPRFTPGEEASQLAWHSFTPLVTEFAAAMTLGQIPQGSASTAARQLWAAMHGVVSLELKGFYLRDTDAAKLYEGAVEAVLHYLQTAQEA
jgi:AcrR family transcriptional regulator